MKHALSPMQGATRVARLTLIRLLRGKLLWIAGLVPLVLLIIAPFTAPNEPDVADWLTLYEVETVLLVIVPAMLLASWVAEEVDDRTYTYLWSRPLPRYSLMLGKLLAMVPIGLILCLVAVVGSFFLFFGGTAGAHMGALGSAVLGLVVGVIGWSATAVGIGSVVPKYATAGIIVYLLFLDSALGNMPFSIRNLATSHHVRIIARATGDMASSDGTLMGSIVWMLGISAIWLGIAVWRVSVTEYSTDD